MSSTSFNTPLIQLKPGKVPGSLRIKTDDSEFPERVVPVRGELR